MKKIVVEHGSDKPKRKEMWSQFHKLRSSISRIETLFRTNGDIS